MNGELRQEVRKLLQQDTRLDGRKHNETRPISIEFGVTRNAEGSAKVTIGETVVISGVKMEVMKPYPDTPNKGSMMVNCELYPMSSPEFQSGPPDIHSIELARITDRGIRESEAIDFKKWCIVEGEKSWMSIVDVCTINDSGNLYDAVALAAMAALLDAKYPGFDGEKIDYKTKTDEKLPIDKIPVTVTVFKYGDNILVDPAFQEEKVYDSRLTVSILEDDSICSFQKGGAGAVSTEELLSMIDLAIVTSKQYRKLLPKV
ncbi:exosome complex protein Rrp42 [Candidatus Woesearchaeota archaeon]|jgi:exosome complex component RRP42|nr:exosome complex protein Rrp42 [Candidatus Woesearchaeota archaeon]